MHQKKTVKHEVKLTKLTFFYVSRYVHVNLRKPINIISKIKFTSYYLAITRKLSRNYEKRPRNYEIIRREFNFRYDTNRHSYKPVQMQHKLSKSICKLILLISLKCIIQ